MDQLNEAAATLALAKEFSEEKKSIDSKNRLRRIMEKKFKTSFIGAISKFETVFGRLWGHGKDYGQLTENEKKFRLLWEQVRGEILNNGNNQIRAMQQEIELYDIIFNGYQSLLTVNMK